MYLSSHSHLPKRDEPKSSPLLEEIRKEVKPLEQNIEKICDLKESTSNLQYKSDFDIIFLENCIV